MFSAKEEKPLMKGAYPNHVTGQPRRMAKLNVAAGNARRDGARKARSVKSFPDADKEQKAPRASTVRNPPPAPGTVSK